MPPISDHLEWLEIRDFSAGLWTAGSAHLMPGSAFQTLEDCFPQPGGGVRAWYAPADMTGTGLPASGEVPIAVNGIAYSSSSTVDYVWLLITRVTSTGGLKAYIQAHGSSTWTLSKTFDAPTTASPGDTAEVWTYEETDGTRVFVVGVFSYPNGAAGTTDGGTWRVTTAGSWSNLSTTFGVKGIYQQRILAVITNSLWWTDPGGTTFPAANYIELDVGFRDISSTPVSLVPFSPSTLLLPTSGGTWVSIEGALDDPIVREMGRNHSLPYHAINAYAVDDDGVWFYEPDHGIYMAQNMGSTFTRMDAQLEPDAWDWGTMYQMQVMDDFLFTPSGRIYDKRSGGWFTSTDLASSRLFLPNGGLSSAPATQLLAVDGTADPSLYAVTTGAGTSRKTSYTVKTAPLRHPNGHQVVVREVEVYVKSLNAEATVAVTVGGTTKTSAALGTGANVVKFGFPAKRGEYLDVQIVPASNTSGEAPLLEAVRVGTRPDSHRLR